jgi:YD repeat-containing protein
LLALALLFSAGVLRAQQGPNLQPGAPAFTPTSSPDGLDDVNLVNGNVSIHIPLISYPQVGGKLKMDFFYYYSSPQPIVSLETPIGQGEANIPEYYTQAGTIYSETAYGPYPLVPNLDFYPLAGFGHSQQITLSEQPLSFVCFDQNCGGSGIGVNQANGSTFSPGGYVEQSDCPADNTNGCSTPDTVANTPVTSFTHWGSEASTGMPTINANPTSQSGVLQQIIDGSGTAHSFAIWSPSIPYTPVMAGDGSGYQPVVSTQTFSNGSHLGYLDSLFDSTGVHYTFKNNQGIPAAALWPSIPQETLFSPVDQPLQSETILVDRTDPNGNLISDGYTSWTDTVGRVIPHESTLTAGNLSLCSAGAVSAQAWTVPGVDSGSLTYTRCYTNMTIQPGGFNWSPYAYYWNDNACQENCPPSDKYIVNGAPWGSSAPQTPQNPTDITLVLSQIVLPNSSSYSLTYDAQGFMKSVGLPAGGSISYSYTDIIWDICNPVAPLHRVPTTRTVTDGLGNSATWTYQWQALSCAQNAQDANVQVTITDPLGNDTVHQHFGIWGTAFTLQAAGYVAASSTVTEVATSYTGTGGSRQLLNTVTTTRPNLQSALVMPRPMALMGGVTETYPGPPTQVVTQWADRTTAMEAYTYVPSGTVTSYDMSNTNSLASGNFPASTCQCVNYTLPATKSEYAFGPGTPGGLVRSTTYTYQMQSSSNGSAYLAANLFDLPSTVTVQDGSGNPLSQTSYVYDNNAAASQGAHGNLTSISRWVNTSPSAPLVTSIAYKPNGMAYLQTDPYGNQTQVNSFQCNGLFPLQVTKAYNSATTVPENFTYGYDATCLKLESMTDPNGIVTKYAYNDPLDRLTLTKLAVGTPQESWTSYSYPSMTQVNIAQDRNSKGDGLLQSSDVYDGLGRNIHSTGTNGATVDTKYDLLGRVHSTSNPHYASSSSTDGTTTYTYDALSRKVLQVQSDGTSVLQWCYNGAVSSGAQSASGLCLPNASSVPNARWVDSIDETGRHWQHVSDALGRLAAVVEPNPSTGALGLETDYGYDALDNLLSVNQKGLATDTARTRGFIYDSLSRLLTDTNSETGTNTYTYLTSGKLCAGDASLPCSKTDARGVTVQYGYDALNRLVQKGFPVLPATSTPNYSYSCYQYDATSVSGASSPGNFVGRLTNSWTQIGSTPPSSFICPTSLPGSVLSRRSILAYDPLGRIQNEQQCTKTNCTTGTPFAPSYSYDLAGNVLTRSNGVASLPITLTNAYDSAGRLSTVTSSITQYPTSLFAASQSASSPGYSPAGALMNATFGTGLTLFRTYDSRLRITGEIDTGNTVQPPTPGAATISITGSDQHQ